MSSRSYYGAGGGSNSRGDDRGNDRGNYRGNDRGIDRGNVCFNWKKGNCSLGNACKFSHNDAGGSSNSGRGGGNYNKGRGSMNNMGDEICDLLRSPKMSDADIYESLFPQNRSGHVVEEIDVKLPKLAKWRFNTKVGVDVPFGQLVANHFKMNSQYLPEVITLYDVTINKMKLISDDEYEIREPKEDFALKGDREITSRIIKLLNNKNSKSGLVIGLAYDGRKHLFVTGKLPFENYEAELYGRRYFVTMKEANEIFPRRQAEGNWAKVDSNLLSALTSGLSSHIRWNEPNSWTVHSGTTIYQVEFQKDLELRNESIIAHTGYNLALKTCLAGVCLVMDFAVAAFIRGGSLMNMIYEVYKGSFRNKDEMHKELKNDIKLLERITKLWTGAKVRTKQIDYPVDFSGNKFKGYYGNKFKGFGPSGSKADFTYTDENGNDLKTTVVDYFQKKYPSLVLKYPDLPVVNIGTTKRSIYIPLELVEIIPGQQVRQRDAQDMNLVKSIMKIAVKSPNDRFLSIRNGFESNQIITSLQNDENSKAFGFTKNSLEKIPMKISAHLLPPPKINYGENRVLDVELQGKWNMRGKTVFYKPGKKGIKVKVAIVSCPVDGADRRIIETYMSTLSTNAERLGLHLDIVTSNERFFFVKEKQDIERAFSKIMVDDIDIVFCILKEDRSKDVSSWYGTMKLYCDKNILPSQCFQYSTIIAKKNAIDENVLLKINTKLSGINHTLASRNNTNLGKRDRNDEKVESVWQQPPNSLSWIFNEPCCIMGIDINHPDPAMRNKSEPSVASVVASMDPQLSEYAAIVSCQTDRTDAFNSNLLTDATHNLIETFYKKNNCYPKRCIVFRDGVSESEFKKLEGEVIAIRNGFEQCGLGLQVKDRIACPSICMIVCQKRHNTRFFYESKNGGYINPCPGLVSDANLYDENKGTNSISSAEYNEFYLNSHEAIKGTSKPCKYTLIHDEIGLQMGEIELLSYWLTALFCRANRSVSYPSPAFYAHFAAKRGRTLLNAGVSRTELTKIFEKWNARKEGTSMFYV